MAGEELSIAELQKLAQYGTAEEREALAKVSRKRAWQAGYYGAFLTEEAESARALQREQAALEIKLRGQRDLKVQIEQNVDELVNRLSEYVVSELDKRDVLIESRIETRIQQLRTEQGQRAGLFSANSRAAAGA